MPTAASPWLRAAGMSAAKATSMAGKAKPSRASQRKALSEIASSSGTRLAVHLARLEVAAIDRKVGKAVAHDAQAFRLDHRAGLRRGVG